ncbi:MAG: tRNA pseudouridine(55) synthase TruB [Sphaerochaetaceae bacterium]|nr:tRNA pseudouridine(55) synthase TruB [Sphaerochaetaceae bacterium]
MRDAIVLINKKPGVTSFSCLGRIKHIINRKTGHCGTLDKFASGLIIALCGRKYTRLNERFMGMDKTYTALIEFGKETDTLDPEGEVIKTSDVPDFETVTEAVKKLTGPIIQVPPLYSALHVNGKRSYQLVREGKEVKLSGRPVTIYSAEILSWEKPFLRIRLKVSKGTYVRSYARDLGELCSSCAYVRELERNSIGPFTLEEAVDYDDEKALSEVDMTKELLKKLEEYGRTDGNKEIL